MSAETDLLPLPDDHCGSDDYPRYDAEQVQAYARANLAELQREVEGLRAEVAEAEKVLRGALDASTDGEPLRVLAVRASNALYWRTERAERAEARAERLAEALQGIAASAEEATTGEGHAECAAIARAALDQETTNG